MEMCCNIPPRSISFPPAPSGLIRWSTFMRVSAGGLFCQPFHKFGWACCRDCGKHSFYPMEISSMRLLSFCTGFMHWSVITFSAETVLSSDSVVNTLPYAAWRISNWEHMVPCSSPFVVGVVCFFLHVLTRTPYSYTYSTFFLQRMRI